VLHSTRILTRFISMVTVIPTKLKFCTKTIRIKTLHVIGRNIITNEE